MSTAYSRLEPSAATSDWPGSLGRLIDQLDQFTDAVTVEQLRAILESTPVSRSDFEAFIRFSQDRFQRNLIHRTDQYEVLLLCFESGQRTPIHDHSDSACAVKIVEGSALETYFDRTPEGWIFATGSRNVPSQGVLASFGSDTHQLSNLQGQGKPLITLHIYSPPLHTVGNYSLTDNRVDMVVAPCESAATQPLPDKQD